MLIVALLMTPAWAGVDPFEEADETELLRAEQTLVMRDGTLGHA